MKNKLLEKLEKLASLAEHQQEVNRGGPFRAKSWDSKPSHKQSRRKEKQKLKRYNQSPEEFQE